MFAFTELAACAGKDTKFGWYEPVNTLVSLAHLMHLTYSKQEWFQRPIFHNAPVKNNEC